MFNIKYEEQFFPEDWFDQTQVNNPASSSPSQQQNLLIQLPRTIYPKLKKLGLFGKVDGFISLYKFPKTLN